MRNPFAGPGWLGPMAGFFIAAVAVSLLGGPALLGLLAGGAVALAWHPLRRNPPWTARGRRAWRLWGANSLALWRAARQLRRARPIAVTRVDPAQHRRQAERFDAVIRVRCQVVSERLQVWHARETGRAYEVFARDSYPEARPGDEGWLSFAGGRARIRPIVPAEPERVLN